VPHVFEFEQVMRLFRAMKEESETDWLMAVVAFNHCLRPREVVGGECVRTDRKTGKITRWQHPGITTQSIVGIRISLKRTKGSEPVDDELLESVNPLLNERQAVLELCLKTPRNQKLFPMTVRTFQRRMNYYGKLAGLPEKWAHPHTLKHSIIDHLRLSGMRLEELQDRSGHKSLDSLRVYMHPKKVETDRAVHTALQRAHV
jgi:integrase